jgi:hypothetical protein
LFGVNFNGFDLLPLQRGQVFIRHELSSHENVRCLPTEWA